MTGLELETEKILEIAIVLTDDHLEVEIEGPSFTIRVDDEFINNMDEWNTKQHSESGLIELSRTNGVEITEAEKLIVSFLEENTPHGSKLELCGNSVWHDLTFLRKEMPNLCSRFIKSVPLLDVSSIALNEYLINPDYEPFEKKRNHRALDDIKESINELRYLRDLHWD